MDAPQTLALSHVVGLLLAAAGGLGLGLLFFGLLGRTLNLYRAGRPVAAGALHAARMLSIASGLWAAVQFGVLPLLACTLGILAARRHIVRQAGRTW